MRPLCIRSARMRARFLEHDRAHRRPFGACHARHCAWIPCRSRAPVHNACLATHDERIQGALLKHGGRPSLARTAWSQSLTSSIITMMFGRRWATTPSGGGVQKAGVEGPVRIRNRDSVRDSARGSTSGRDHGNTPRPGAAGTGQGLNPLRSRTSWFEDAYSFSGGIRHD